MDINFLGIDLGKNTGISLLDHTDAILYSENWKLRDEVGGSGKIGRFIDLDNRLREFLFSNLNCSLIAGYEKVFAHAGTEAAHDYGAYQSIILRIFSDFKISYYPLAVGSIKAYGAGKGNASKAEMLKAANDRWNINIKDDNQADSLFIASLARYKFSML